MKIREIEAKTLLAVVKQPDDWFGLKYNMNLYRGCQHRCIYCDSRSLCYGIDNFDTEILVKANAPTLLRRELASKRIKGTIGTGSMNDPYMPVERKIELTRRALAIIAEFRFPVHIITKSNLVTRDLELLVDINRTFATVSFSITAADDRLGKQVEPGAPLVSERFKAMAALAARGVNTGVTLMPVLPFIEDNSVNIGNIVKLAADHGASYVFPAFGVTLRDRQRDYFYRELDRRFPGLSRQYQRIYGERYSASPGNARLLKTHCRNLCREYDLATRIPRYTPPGGQQLRLF